MGSIRMGERILTLSTSTTIQGRYTTRKGKGITGGEKRKGAS